MPQWFAVVLVADHQDGAALLQHSADAVSSGGPLAEDESLIDRQGREVLALLILARKCVHHAAVAVGDNETETGVSEVFGEPGQHRADGPQQSAIVVVELAVGDIYLVHRSERLPATPPGQVNVLAQAELGELFLAGIVGWRTPDLESSRSHIDGLRSYGPHHCTNLTQSRTPVTERPAGKVWRRRRETHRHRAGVTTSSSGRTRSRPFSRNVVRQVRLPE